MSERLFRRVVRTDGHEGHWFDYEPVETFNADCSRCALSNDDGYWCYSWVAETDPEGLCHRFISVDDERVYIVCLPYDD